MVSGNLNLMIKSLNSLSAAVLADLSSVVIHYYQYVLVSTRARFEMNIIHRDDLERRSGKD